MKILLTGATGFVGKHLLKRLISNNIDVVIIKNKNSIKNLSERVIEYVFDYDDVEKDINFLTEQNIDGVIHLASSFVVKHETKDIKSLIHTNIFFSTYLLDCSVNANIKWFINTGTFWQNYQNRNYSPVNLYAATKQAFMDIAQYYIETNKIKFVTLKLADTYGPFDTRPKIINVLINALKTGNEINMSPGEQILDLSHIEDVIEAYYILIKKLHNNEIKNGSIFAVTSNERISLKKLVEIFENISRKKLNINWGGKPYREREVMIPWEDGVPVPGWEPKISLEKGIKELIKLNG